VLKAFTGLAEVGGSLDRREQRFDRSGRRAGEGLSRRTAQRVLDQEGHRAVARLCRRRQTASVTAAAARTEAFSWILVDRVTFSPGVQWTLWCAD